MCPERIPITLDRGRFWSGSIAIELLMGTLTVSKIDAT